MLSLNQFNQIKHVTKLIFHKSIANINCFSQSRTLIASTLRTYAVRLAYASYEYPENSQQPPIFIFHGLLGNKMQWEGIGKNILSLTKRKVVAVDLRNHGESPHTDSHKYTEQAKDILCLFEQIGARQASLVGYSMGGRTAMCVALMAPHKVAGLLAVDISPITTPPHFKDYVPKLLRAMRAINFEKIPNVSAAKKYASKQLCDIVSDHDMLKGLLTNVRQKPDRSISWACNIDVLIKDYDYWVSFPKVMSGVKYYGPTLFLGGQLSEFLPPDELNKIRSLFPRAVVTYITKTGHQVQADDPNSFLNITASFLRRHKYYEPKPVIKK